MNKYNFPAIFIGHGSPMNVIAHNAYTGFLKRYGEELGQPKAIVVISAHWLTSGSFITAAMYPEQIYDFWGFPQELYDVKYKSNGNPDIAALISDRTGIIQHGDRGIDHAAWAVLVHLFPHANIPVLEISLDMTMPFENHYKLGQTLKDLRKENILFIGSGNLVHNIRDISYEETAPPFEWAVEIDRWIKEKTEQSDTDSLIHILERHSMAKYALPTPDHYLPLLYIMGMQDENEHVYTRHESIQNGSISMRCLEIK